MHEYMGRDINFMLVSCLEIKLWGKCDFQTFYGGHLEIWLEQTIHPYIFTVTHPFRILGILRLQKNIGLLRCGCAGNHEGIWPPDRDI